MRSCRKCFCLYNLYGLGIGGSKGTQLHIVLPNWLHLNNSLLERQLEPGRFALELCRRQVCQKEPGELWLFSTFGL